MRLFKKAPNWVNTYPSEIDRMALVQLAKSSKGKFDKPREMNFVLYDFANRQVIENAVAQIEQEGWHCTVLDQSEEPGKYVVECQKQGYGITEEAYIRDTAYFKRVADLYRVHYDGWYASA
jgi:hypothetical protein